MFGKTKDETTEKTRGKNKERACKDKGKPLKSKERLRESKTNTEIPWKAWTSHEKEENMTNAMKTGEKLNITYMKKKHKKNMEILSKSVYKTRI